MTAGGIVCERLVRIYRTGDRSEHAVEVQALQGLDLSLAPGELVALVGASGSGKSTLLAILSGSDAPTGGRVEVAGHDLTRLRGRGRVHYRRHVVGFVWQQTSRNLLPYLTAAENVAFPMTLTRISRRDRDRRCGDLLELLGVGDCARRRPDALSGGQQQRVALAVALANSPAVLLADEPTGELDETTSHQVFDAMRTANRELGVTVLVVTHDLLVSDQVDRAIAIRDGRVSSERLRRAEVDREGRRTVVAEEYAVLDRAGRLQLPGEFVATLGLAERVRLSLEPDHIAVWPGPSADDGRGDG